MDSTFATMHKRRKSAFVGLSLVVPTDGRVFLPTIEKMVRIEIDGEWA